MTDNTISFSRTASDESRILSADGAHLGDVYAYDDTLSPGRRVYEVHLVEDWRGPVRLHERAKVRETAQRMVDTLPWR
ncbi:MAG: hypothetical protein OXH87_00735 [Rhodospirillaceae bacterium]|nr:hypothetical protein [Rhodospirillaceae bacterium]